MKAIKFNMALFTLIIALFVIPSNVIFACDNDSYSKTLEYIENDVVYMLNECDHTASVCEVKNVNLTENYNPRKCEEL